MTLWTVDQTVQAVRDALPEDWSYEIYPETASAAILDGETVVWERADPDLRLLSFHAWGWLKVRGKPAPTNAWAPRTSELSTSDVVRKANEVEDPPDIDPEEIRKCYQEKGEI